VKNGDRGLDPLYLVVEDLRRQVEELEEELARLRADHAAT
jgi:ribosomal protein L29